MKQKFTLQIADLQLSIITDASVEDVERISGLLDRKMREIYLKSRCPKTEAALLCAMEFVADRFSLQEQNAELEDRCEKYALVLENLKERTTDQAAEIERLRNENDVLRSLLTRAADAPAEEPEAPIAPDPISPTEFLASVADAQNEPVDDPAPAPVVEEPAPAPQKSRSRVGSMFDLLSFGEAD